jgi:hypothetical protein
MASIHHPSQNTDTFQYGIGVFPENSCTSNTTNTTTTTTPGAKSMHSISQHVSIQFAATKVALYKIVRDVRHNTPLLLSHTSPKKALFPSPCKVGKPGRKTGAGCF